MSELQEFYAVTVKGSMYHIRMNPEQPTDPIVEKVAGLKADGLPIGTRLNDGYYIGITNFGIMRYHPQGNGREGRPTSALMSNILYHGGKTTPVVALFLDRQMARVCMEQRSETPWDPQWRGCSKQVLEAIGAYHDRFIIDEDVTGT